MDLTSTLHSNIGRRMLLLAAVSMLPVLAALAVSGWMAVRESQRWLGQERQFLAESVVAHVGYVLQENEQRLSDVQFAAGVNIADTDNGPEQRALHAAYLGSLFDTLVITDRTGLVKLVEPSRPALIGEDLGALSPVAEALALNRIVISDLVPGDGTTGPVIYIVSPLRAVSGQLMGVVAGTIDLARPELSGLLPAFQMGQGMTVDIVDGGGAVIASTDAARVLTVAAGGEKGLVSAAGLAVGGASWQVAVSQPSNAAFAPAQTLGATFLIAGLVSIVLVFFLSLGMARSLVNPVRRLKTAAQIISRGNLDEPVPSLGSDEIGELSRSFDVMRLELRKSVNEISEWNRQLEERIEERTRQLQASYREIEAKDAMRTQLLQKVLMAQEEERKRVARELHDETTQSILGISMRLEAAAALPDAAVGKIKALVSDVRNLAVTTLDSVHKVIFDLRPSVLDDLGLISAIRWYAKNRLEPRGVKARVEVSGDERPLPPQIEITLFRVAQEAMTNIARHADARHVVITVEFLAGRVAFEVEDDGRGFDPAVRAEHPSGLGVGLMGMRERVELLGGTFDLESQPRGGTRIRAEVPLA
jgi:signal transduction histidine kinase